MVRPTNVAGELVSHRPLESVSDNAAQHLGVLRRLRNRSSAYGRFGSRGFIRKQPALEPKMAHLWLSRIRNLDMRRIRDPQMGLPSCAGFS